MSPTPPGLPGSAAACAACAYWHAPDRLAELAGGDGECRRHAPRPRPPWPGGYMPTDSAWPLTAAADWCGEHVPAPALPRLGQARRGAA